MGFDIDGKVALVTGSNRGIGKSIVEGLLGRGASKVYAGARKTANLAGLVERFGDRVVPVEIDLERPASVEAAASNRDVELVVNNAGILKAANLLLPEAEDALKAEFEVNVLGPMRMARAFSPVLAANGGGAFVQLNSVVSIKSFPDFATYCASKAASYSITQSLRSVLGKQGTQVVSVHPGPIATDMATSAGLQDVAEPPSVVVEAIVSALASGEFHAFPDSMARDLWKAYEGFARSVVEADLAGG
ncbi:SDR family oxidoreductase [Aquisphaera insulae]|uniref:SDR family oxidoreductase n=1 Tax=Aquisphaera insulae TaxID=2712864 RepID=UPI0013EB31BA|nr:SDR family oxidoreductase [Aquisphaera insulae]